MTSSPIASTLSLSPFQATSERRFKKISAEGKGYVYLKQQLGLSPRENPNEDQDREKALVEMEMLVFEAAKRVGAELNISVGNARKLLFDSDLKEAEEVEANDDAGAGVVKAEADKKTGNDYLTVDEMRILLEMQVKRKDLAKLSTTKFMRHRMAWATELTGKVGSPNKPFSAEVDPLFFPVAEGDTFICNGGRFKVLSSCEAASATIELSTVIVPLTALKPGDPLFLVDPGTGFERVGCEWTDAMTEGVDYQIQEAVREFFVQEAAGSDGPIKKEGDDDESDDGQEALDAAGGNSKAPSKRQQKERRSIGSASTSDSST